MVIVGTRTIVGHTISLVKSVTASKNQRTNKQREIKKQKNENELNACCIILMIIVFRFNIYKTLFQFSLAENLQNRTSVSQDINSSEN